MRNLLSSLAASSSLVAVMVVSIFMLSWTNLEQASVASPTMQCKVAAASYSVCLQSKYGACKGKTGTALVTCMQTAAKSGATCSISGLTTCLSPTCQAAVTSLQQCVQRLKTACTGMTGTALQACIKQTSASGCDSTSAQACTAEAKATASSLRSASARSASAASQTQSSASSKKPWWKLW